MNDNGYPLPDDLDPEGVICVCVPIPNDFRHKLAFLGQLDMLSRWYTWAKDDAHSGRIAAARWRTVTAQVRKDLDMDCGCGGGGVLTPTNQRYDQYGNLEISTDGGATWENGNELDPRFNAPLIPALTGTGEDVKCNSAWGAARFLEEQIIDQLDTGQALAAILSLVATVLAVVITAGAATPLAVSLSSAILGTGIAVVKAALTAAVFDDLACLIYCRMDDSGAISEDEWRGLQDDVNAEFTGVANDIIIRMIQMVGPVGLTNAGRVQRLSGSNCETCPCEDGWCKVFDFTTGQHGWTPATGYQTNYVAGQGWTWGDAANPDRCFIKRSFDFSATYTFIQVEISSPMNGNANYWYFCNNANVGCSRQTVPPLSGGLVFQRAATFTSTIISTGFEQSSTNPPVPFNRYITKITMSGPGANPFGENNC